MPINGETAMPMDEAWAAYEFPDETGKKRKKNRLIVSAGSMGPQMAIVPPLELYPEEEDPNP